MKVININGIASHGGKVAIDPDELVYLKSNDTKAGDNDVKTKANNKTVQNQQKIKQDVLGRNDEGWFLDKIDDEEYKEDEGGNINKISMREKNGKKRINGFGEP